MLPKIKIRDWRIIACPKCRTLQIVRSDQKTRRCPKCNHTIKLDYMKLRILFKSRNLKDVQYALQRLKEKQAGVEQPKFQTWIHSS